MALSLGKIISDDLETLTRNEEFYPSFNEVDLEKLLLEVPSTLPESG